jgi:hypothetical protein
LTGLARGATIEEQAGTTSMADISNLDLRKAEQADQVDSFEPAGPRVPRWFWLALVAFFAAVAVTIFVVSKRRPAAEPPAPVAAKPAPTDAARPLGGDAERVDVPPLDQSDAIVRELVRRITSNPTALKWLATDGLIRNFAVVVANVVADENPARHLRALTPSSSFQTVERGGELFVDPRGYERYDRIAGAAASIDAEGAARVYATLKPRIEEAYGDLGVQPASFDRALEQAIVSLLRTPVVDGPIRVRPKGIGYAYSDPKLEGLSAAQKQLLRAGPRNVQLIQASLRRIALALGIPPERLP